MTDHDAIARLIFGYAEQMDLGDFDGVAGLFAHATLRSNLSPTVRQGTREVGALYREMVILYEGIPCTKHVTTNLIIDIEARGDQASARSYFTVFQARPELALQPIIAGRYHDQFSRHDGQWRFSDRLILVDLVGDLRWHLRSMPRIP
jgi:3-phenylpropionate/cinnamic acid dioxygenase small subunit